MAHDLTKRADGTYEMAYVGQTPWHGLGTNVEKAMTADEALKISQTDWEVIRAESAFTDPMTKEVIKTPGWTHILRADTRTVLHVARKSFTPLQNRDAYRLADKIIGGGNAHYVTAGSIGGGKKVWMLAELSKSKVVVAGDEIKPYFLFYNAHDGTSRARAILTPVRVICANTLSYAVGGEHANAGFAFRHTANIESQVAAAQDALGIIQQGYDDMGEKFNFLASEKYNEAAIKSYAALLFPHEKAAGDVAIQNTNARREILVHLAAEGQGNTRPQIKGTWWAAYNGATEILDHLGGWKSNEGRMNDLIWGDRASRKSKALSLALSGAENG